MAMQIAARILAATFDPALAQNTGQNVDVAIPSSIGSGARCLVNSILIVSEENLAFDILFFGKATHGTTYDTDSYLGHWAFAAGDAITYTGDEISAAYRYWIPDLDLPYEDQDAGASVNHTPHLHITLVPRGAAHVIHKKISVVFNLQPDTAWSGR